MTITEMLQKAEEAEALGIPVDYKRLSHLINQAAERQLAAHRAEREKTADSADTRAVLINAADILEELVDGSMPHSVQCRVLEVVRRIKRLTPPEDSSDE